jgi:hypothetical protein
MFLVVEQRLAIKIFTQVEIGGMKEFHFRLITAPIGS